MVDKFAFGRYNVESSKDILEIVNPIIEMAFGRDASGNWKPEKTSLWGYPLVEENIFGRKVLGTRFIECEYLEFVTQPTFFGRRKPVAWFRNFDGSNIFVPKHRMDEAHKYCLYYQMLIGKEVEARVVYYDFLF